MAEIETDDVLGAEFLKACQEHDLTYQYSDDHRYWLAGEASMKRIRALAARMSASSVRRIWNAVVDTKIVEGHRERFYWSP